MRVLIAGAGIGGELAATGIPTAEMVHFDRHGNRIWGFACGLSVGYRWPQYSIHRGELLHTVSVRASDGFGRIEDVLSAAELAAFDEAYRTTTLPDVAALDSRPSLTP
jgi:hypothetical protein